MFRLDQALKVYLHREPIDFRLNINGLALLVEQALGLDPFAPCAYVFSNRRRNRVKILGWDRADAANAVVQHLAEDTRVGEDPEDALEHDYGGSAPPTDEDDDGAVGDTEDADIADALDPAPADGGGADKGRDD